MKVTGAYVVLECLKRLGVNDIFGYPGGAVIPIYNELFDFDGINHVFVRHEQAAAHAADGYYKSSGKTSAVLATSGPGATNLVTGIMSAYMDSIPMICITGQVDQSLIGKDAFQETDIIGITLPITKYSVMVKKIEDIIPRLYDAYNHAHDSRPGPVLLDIVKDVQMQTIEIDEMNQMFESVVKKEKENTFVYKVGDEDTLKTLLRDAKKPMIIAGAGVVFDQGAELLNKFIEKYDVPVTTTLLGLGLLKADSKYNMDMLGMHGSTYANRCLDQADLVIAIGSRFDDRITGDTKRFIENAKIIHIDIDESEINKNKLVDVGIVTNASQGIEKLIELSEVTKHDEFMEYATNLKASFPFQVGNKESFSARKLIRHVSNLAEPDAIVVTDVGQHQMWTAQHFSFNVPYQIVTSGGAGTMGYGVCAAIGCAIANPDRQVICFVGDGGVQMTMQEFMTIKQYNLNVKVVIVNNSYLGMVRQWQELFNNSRYSFVDLETSPDFLMLASSFGLANHQVDSSENVIEIDDYITSVRPCVLDCRVVKEENVYPMIPSGKSVDQLIVEVLDE